MNTTDAARLAHDLMDDHGLIDDGWRFGWSQANRQFGRCEYRTKMIKLSKPVTEINTEEEVLDTILHEIAHALTPGAGHGPEWKRKARELGARPQATTSRGVAVPARWNLSCPACDFAAPRHRKTKILASCPKCDPRRFNPLFELTWVDTRDSVSV